MENADALRERMRRAGSKTSTVKAEMARENGALGGRPEGSVKPLSEIECTCGGGDSLNHKARCPRGRAIKYRKKKGLELK